MPSLEPLRPFRRPRLATFYPQDAGTPWTVLLAAADTSSEGPKRPASRVLHGFGAWAKPGAKRQTQAGVAGWPNFEVLLWQVSSGKFPLYDSHC